MPTQTQIQNSILSGRGIMLNKALANLSKMSVGDNEVKWADIRRFKRTIIALQYQFNMGDYTSTQTLELYDCLTTLIGIDPTVNTIDPNYQPNTGTIIISNPNTYLNPIPNIPYSAFDPITQQPDTGRYIYYNSAWKGINPVLSLTSPVETALNLGVDYILIPTGGIQLLATGAGGAIPGGLIYDGDSLRATSYVIA